MQVLKMKKFKNSNEIKLLFFCESIKLQSFDQLIVTRFHAFCTLDSCRNMQMIAKIVS